MRIRAKLNASVLVLLLTAIVVGIFFYRTGREINRAVNKNKEINEIVKGVFELNLLTSDYLLYESDRARTQWRLRHTSLATHLQGRAFILPAEQSTLARVRQDYNTINRLFLQIVKEHERDRASTSEESDDLDTRERLVAQILIRSQSMVYDTQQLAGMISSSVMSLKTHVGILALTFVTVIGAQLIVMIYFISKSVVKPMALLERGTELIASGDLDHKVDIKGSDEMAQLAQAFNSMTDRLRRSFRKLEVEVRERERAERTLAEEMEELDVTLDSIGDGVITADSAGMVRLVNPVAELLTGWGAQESKGRPLTEVFQISHDSDSQSDDETVPGSGNGRAPSVIHKRTLTAKDGRNRPIQDTVTPIRLKDGTLIGTVVVFRDVTEQSALQRETMRIQKLESVGVLAGGIAHDFNNILTAILGSLSLASFDMDSKDSSYSLLKEAEKATTRAKKLTQQLLTFSKGGAPVKTTSFLEELLRESATFALRGSNVSCDLQVDAGLWTAEVDTGQISQVIQNLVINGKQAMKEGGVISVRAENLLTREDGPVPIKSGKYIKITVADQGVGIPPENLDKIFDPYFSTKSDGSGLGLAIIHSIIINHGGYINVESTVCVGTKFYIFLPASTRLLVHTPTTALEENEAVPRVGRGKILVMDDEKVIGKIAGRMINRLGYKFEIAVNGENAIEQFLNARTLNQPFDLVILDLTIRGGMGGRDVIKTLLEIDQQTRAIVSSGYSNDPIMANFENYGFKGVIVKPYKFETLRDTIEQFLPRV